MDIHKDMHHIVVMKNNGVIKEEIKIENTLYDIDNFFRRIPKNAKIAMEASTASKPVYHHLRKMGYDVRMANPIKIRMIAESKDKRDANDAYILANLLRMNYLPSVFVPTEKWEEIRSICRYRVSLGRNIASVKNQITSLLLRNGIRSEFSDPFGVNGLNQLRDLKLSYADSMILSSLLCVLEALVKEAKRIEDILAKYADEIHEVQLLMTIPGVDFYSALVILSELGGDIHRFPDAKKLAKYAGLVPKIHQSADVEISGHITKEGPSLLRWILSIVTHSALKQKKNHRLRNFYMRLIRRRKLKSVAIIATAKKLLRIIYVMLTNGEKYEDEDSVLAARKINKMKAKARKNIETIDTDEIVRRLQCETYEIITYGETYGM